MGLQLLMTPNNITSVLFIDITHGFATALDVIPAETSALSELKTVLTVMKHETIPFTRAPFLVLEGDTFLGLRHVGGVAVPLLLRLRTEKETRVAGACV